MFLPIFIPFCVEFQKPPIFFQPLLKKNPTTSGVYRSQPAPVRRGQHCALVFSKDYFRIPDVLLWYFFDIKIKKKKKTKPQKPINQIIHSLEKKTKKNGIRCQHPRAKKKKNQTKPQNQKKKVPQKTTLARKKNENKKNNASPNKEKKKTKNKKTKPNHNPPSASP